MNKNKNKQLEIRVRDLELELSRITQDFHRKEAELSKLLIVDKDESHNSSSLLIKELKSKLDDYESELMAVKESESKLKFEVDLLTHRNIEIKKK
jgi:hypothetical protein